MAIRTILLRKKIADKKKELDHSLINDGPVTLLLDSRRTF